MEGETKNTSGTKSKTLYYKKKGLRNKNYPKLMKKKVKNTKVPGIVRGIVKEKENCVKGHRNYY